jgi:hypothetical protein
MVLSLVEVRPRPHIETYEDVDAEGSVIGNHHEIELVPPDVRALSSYQIPTNVLP